MLSILVSMTRERVIGRANEIPWHIKGELALFKKLTTGNTILMGRKTFESIGRVLPDRHNVILSRTLDETDDADVCRSLSEALGKAEAYRKEVFIIGGESVFNQTISLVEKLYVSYIKKDFAGDKFFPEIRPEDWDASSAEDMGEFDHVVYTRKSDS